MTDAEYQCGQRYNQPSKCQSIIFLSGTVVCLCVCERESARESDYAAFCVIRPFVEIAVKKHHGEGPIYRLPLTHPRPKKQAPNVVRSSSSLLPQITHIHARQPIRTALPQLERQTAAATPMYPKQDAQEGHCAKLICSPGSTILLMNE
jgi:hypothetical protein